MNEIVEIENKNIEDMIYEVRGKQVMLDFDLARLYSVETKRINEAVKNNLDKFPERFSWILTNEEENILRSKISTSSLKNNHGGRRYNTRVFTEQGVAMLATILKSKIATQVSINIMDAFVNMRKFIKENIIEQKYINNLVFENYENIKSINDDIRLLQESFNKLEEKEFKNKIFMNGKFYDSYSFIIDILNKAKKEIIIIDNYADKTILDIISNLNTNVILITKKNNLLRNIDIDKYNKQYNNLKVIYNNDFHDRFIILDNIIIYHLGSSINHIGNKIFAINNINEDEMKISLLNKIKEMM